MFLKLLIQLTSSAVDQGCVGAKFFEGLINLTYLKKIKRRLQDTMDCYSNKIELSQQETSPKKDFYVSLHKCVLRKK